MIVLFSLNFPGEVLTLPTVDYGREISFYVETQMNNQVVYVFNNSIKKLFTKSLYNFNRWLMIQETIIY